MNAKQIIKKDFEKALKKIEAVTPVHGQIPIIGIHLAMIYQTMKDFIQALPDDEEPQEKFPCSKRRCVYYIYFKMLTERFCHYEEV